MSCKIQTSSKYSERPSPPIKAKDCPGETKKGNDGLMYTSKQISNGQYRWSKSTKTTKKVESTKTTTKKVAAKTPKAPTKKDCRPDQVRNPVTGRCKKVESTKTTKKVDAKTPKAPTKKVAAKTPKAPTKKSTSTRKGSRMTSSMTVEVEDLNYDKFKVTFNPVFSRPSGENWIFYDKDANEFRRPTFGRDEYGFIGGNQRMDQYEVEYKIDRDVPVWVIDGDFGEFEE